MPQLIDLHADTITALYYNTSNLEYESEYTNLYPQQELLKNNLQIDLNKLKAANSLAQFFALWVNLAACVKHNIEPIAQLNKLYQCLIEQINKNSDLIQLVKTTQELEAAKNQQKLAAFIGLEEGGVIKSLTDLDLIKSMGVKYITLVWNYQTQIGTPSKLDQHKGLTPFGREVVIKMQELGILVDVSHLSDQGVYDVLQLTKKPIIASHSNVRALANHPRNLTDDLIKKIANTGGIIGVSCVPKFLKMDLEYIDIDLWAKHILYLKNLVGSDALAIGSDFDGFLSDKPEEDQIKSIAKIERLILKLEQNGFDSVEIEKLFNLNVLRVLKGLE